MHGLTALDQIAENRVLSGWLRVFSRRPDQLNGPHQADAELVPIPGTHQLLAITVDTLAEEIELGFYRDPETMGWMSATASLSDLAAVGARPIGMLLSATLPAKADASYQHWIACGFEAACAQAKTHVLGGDTSSGPLASLTSVAVGLVSPGGLLMRTGCRPGDLVYTSGRLGAGGPVALRALFPALDERPTPPFRPQARIAASRALAGFATACMDTSDGLVATLDQLGRLNGVGFEITAPLTEFLDPEAAALSHRMGVDPLLMLAQPHGEFELVFTVPSDERERFEAHAVSSGLHALHIGQVIRNRVLRITHPTPRDVDAAGIRNLLAKTNADPEQRLAELIRLVERPVP